MDSIGKFFTGLIMIIVSTIVVGFVLMKTWAWFVVPVFTSLPKMTFGQAVGLSVFLSILIARKDDKEIDFDELVEKFFGGLIFTALLFLFAWLVYVFIR